MLTYISDLPVKMANNYSYKVSVCDKLAAQYILTLYCSLFFEKNLFYRVLGVLLFTLE